MFDSILSKCEAKNRATTVVPKVCADFHIQNNYFINKPLLTRVQQAKIRLKFYRFHLCNILSLFGFSLKGFNCIRQQGISLLDKNEDRSVECQCHKKRRINWDKWINFIRKEKSIITNFLRDQFRTILKSFRTISLINYHCQQLS